MALNLDSMGELSKEGNSGSLGLLLEFSIPVLVVQGPLRGSNRNELGLTQAKKGCVGRIWDGSQAAETS